MNANLITGIGKLGHAIGYLCDEKKYDLAFTYFMQALGLFGVQENIKAAMEAPPGHPSPVFMKPPVT